MRPRARHEALGAALVATLAFLPFLRGAWSGASLYFRDLARYFFPLRRYALDGLARGELRLWNPLVHEGVPLSLPALGYPLDALQLLRPGEAGLSLVLALHVPLAAVTFRWLCRRLGLESSATAAGALVYALGGFLLSSVNLYVYVQAAAWAPLVVLGLVRVLQSGSRRAVALAALSLALAVSTTGVEIVGQAVLAGLVLGWPSERRARGAAAALLAMGLALAAAAPVLVLVGSQLEGSARGHGFATDVVLAHSVHPFTLLQTVVAGLYGNPSNLANEWWGQNFFPLGFPYILSLYLGAPALALALAGLTGAHPLRRRLAFLAACGLLATLGSWGGLRPVVETLSFLRVVRFPVKAFFTVHLAVAALAALGVQSLLVDRRAWRRLAVVASACGLTLTGLVPLARALPGAASRFAAAFLPTGYDEAARSAVLGRVLGDAATGGALALLLALVALSVWTGRLSSRFASVACLAIVTCDLLRAGAGLNPMVDASFLRPRPELAARVADWRGARLFTCTVEDSPAYLRAREGRPGHHELWTMAALLETITPALNVPLGVPTAMSPDLTMLVPEDRTLSPELASCRSLDETLPRLRAAGVERVLSVTPLDHPGLDSEPVLRSARLAPLVVYPYRLSGSAPFAELVGPNGQAVTGGAARPVPSPPGRLRFDVEAPQPARLVVLEGWSAGWHARVGGNEATVARVAGSHLGVAVPAGHTQVEFRFFPRRLPVSVALSALALAAIAWLALGGRARRATSRAR